MLDAKGFDVYASNMKTVSARMLMLVADANELDVLAGDISVAYLYAENAMKVLVRLGHEFTLYDPNIKEGQYAIVVRAQYGQPTSANRWHAHLANNLLNLGFRPSRYDRDVWIRYNKRHDLYDYVGTHTDDLLVCSKDAKSIFDALQEIYDIKKVGPPTFHLGCDYKKIDGRWHIGTVTYVREALKKVVDILGIAQTDGEPALGVEKVPMNTRLEPEMDESPLLDADGHRNYQALIGIAQWLVTCGRTDIHYAVCSLSSFSSAPRKGHLKAAKTIYQYLNGRQEIWNPIDSGKFTTMKDKVSGECAVLDLPNKDEEHIDWAMYYPDAKEMHGRELDLQHPKPKGAKLTSAVYFDSNFAHDKKTRRSVTGMIPMIGRTAVGSMSKRQGAIATSTYSAELCAAKQGTEEAVALRYMMRSLGVEPDGPTLLIGDNLGSLTSATFPGSECKKRHQNIAYHYTRECAAASITQVRKIHTDFNPSDMNTKALDKDKLDLFINYLFYAPKQGRSVARY